MKKLLPLIILAALGLLGWLLWKKKGPATGIGSGSGPGSQGPGSSPGQTDILSWLTLKYNERKIDYDAYVNWYYWLADGAFPGIEDPAQRLNADYQDGKMVYEVYLGIWNYL